jgi:hypothetical protein
LSDGIHSEPHKQGECSNKYYGSDPALRHKVIAKGTWLLQTARQDSQGNLIKQEQGEPEGVLFTPIEFHLGY